MINNPVDYVLNRITMYRLVLYYLAALIGLAFVLGIFGIGSGLGATDPSAIAFSLAVITGTGWFTNFAFARLMRIPPNTESVYITALIVALIMPPVTSADPMGIWGLVLATFAAIASKFVLAINRRHIFNPVAVGVVASAFLLDQPATWWVGGNVYLLPVTIVGGLLVTRKVQRFDMVGAYIAANLAATLATTPPEMMAESLKFTLAYSPLFFAGFAMLTEPLTAPPARWSRVVYGIVIGVLSSPNIAIAGFYLTPEIAFLAGNLFAFVTGFRRRVRLTLVGIEKMAAGCYDFVFRPDRPFRFRPGQYMDWTLPVRHADDRGSRRPFTIASAPGDEHVRLGVKFYPGASAYKRALAAMKRGDIVYGANLAGSFTLPNDPDEKLAFLAGGIGVTPFRSMVGDMLNRGDRRSVVMLYGNNRADEIAYRRFFDCAAAKLDFRCVYAAAEGSPDCPDIRSGFIDEDMIRREVPDFAERTFYISGPRAMVVHFEKVLKGLGIHRRNIRVDFFPGFV